MRQKFSWLFDKKFLSDMLPLAIPIALQNLLMCSFRLVDTLMIGRLGDTSIAAVGLAGQISFFVELVVFGLGSGSAVFIAQYHGAKNGDGIFRAFGATLVFAIPCGLLFTAVATLFPAHVMSIMTNDPTLIAEGANYIRYACVSYLGTALYQPLAVVLRSTENVRIPMVTSMCAAVANAVLNYVLIFGKLGFAAYGVAGAGIATAISSMLNPVLIFIISLAQKNVVAAPLRKLFDIRGFLGEYWRRVLPVLCNEMFWSLASVGVNMVYGRMGADNYAAVTVFRTVENILFVFFIGICNACNILVGKRIGANDIAGAKAYANRFLLFVPLFGFVLGALVLLVRAPVIGLFDVSATAARTAQIMLFIYAFEITLRNIPFLSVVGIFRAGGDTKAGLRIDVGVQYLLVLPMAVVCGLVLKLPFLTTYLLVMLVEDLAKVSLSLIHYFRMTWIRPVAGLYEAEAGYFESCK